MKVFVLCAMMALGAALRRANKEEIEMIFEKVLEDEEITLDASEYDYRLAGFTLGYMAGKPGDGVNLEMMYDLDELKKQHGAKLIPTLKSELQEELNKRGVDPFAMDAPAYYKPIVVNEVVHQGVCGNCYLHTFIAALEISYYKSTGKRLKFSEQEMTDCYNNGCEGGDYRMVAITMNTVDKLSHKSYYGPYKSKQLTCRADTTPDSLSAVKVEGYIDVPGDVNKIEAAIATYGSVMTCMRWGETPADDCHMATYQAGQVVDYPAVPGGCDHAVLIIGYTPDYWIVRNSHGKDWGESGNFRIKKGINSCGIEENMAVVVTSIRSTKKSAGNYGCPLSKPNLCKSTYSCTGGSGCAKPITLIEEVEKEVEVEKREVKIPGEREKREVKIPGEREKREVKIPGEREKRDEEEEDDDDKRYRGGADSNLGKREEDDKKRFKNVPGGPFLPGKLAELQRRGFISEEDAFAYLEKKEDDEDIVQRCADRSPQCRALAAQGMNVCTGQMVAHCMATCRKCSNSVKPKPKDTGETQGKCLKPAIANGVVYNGNTLSPGEAVKVKCNAGYTLVGGTAKCLIQDTFTNDDKDGRLLPECIRLGGNTLIGNGASYMGTKNTYTGTDPYTRRPVQMECDSWNKDVLRGILLNYKNAQPLLLGNHNYCRNPGGIEPVPFCIAAPSGAGKINYCFGHAGCDTCAGAADKYGADYCGDSRNTRYCLYTDKSTQNRVAAIQENCAATCCALAGC